MSFRDSGVGEQHIEVRELESAAGEVLVDVDCGVGLGVVGSDGSSIFLGSQAKERVYLVAKVACVC